MSETTSTIDRFMDAIQAARVQDWVKTEQFLDICEEHSVFDEEDQSEMVRRYKLQSIRRMLRQMSKAADADTEAIEWVNIKVLNSDGSTTQAYKQLDLFEIGDFVQVIRDRQSRVDYWKAEVQRFIRLGESKFGKRLQSLLPFAT